MERGEARGSSPQKVFRLKPELRFHSTSSEEPETRFKQERMIPLPRCVGTLGDRGEEHGYCYPVGCRDGHAWALAGGWKRDPFLLFENVGAVEHAPLCAPSLGWHSTQNRDLSLQAMGFPKG